MNAHFKYIVIIEHGMEVALIVPELVSHDHAINLKEVKPISAGFCTVKDGVVECHGFSTSLNLSSRKGDATIVLTTLLFMGIRDLKETGPLFTPGLTDSDGAIPSRIQARGESAPALLTGGADLPVCQRRGSDALPQSV